MRRIIHGSQRRIWQGKGDGEAILEADRQTARGKEKSNTTNGMRGMFVFGSGCSVSWRGFSRMIGEGSDIGGRLWSC
jgi:hypothetical protein